MKVSFSVSSQSIFKGLSTLKISQNSIERVYTCYREASSIDIYYMSKSLAFELYNIFLRNFKDRCQMTRK